MRTSFAMDTEMTEEQLQKALMDPAGVFANPRAVVEEQGLSNERKIEILRRWEYDARELQVADEEGMRAGRSGSVLDDVLAALDQLGAEPDSGQSAPTKQGGV